MDEEALGIYLIRNIPRMDADRARPGPVEMKADDLGIVEARYIAEPCQKLRAAGHCLQNPPCSSLLIHSQLSSGLRRKQGLPTTCFNPQSADFITFPEEAPR